MKIRLVSESDTKTNQVRGNGPSSDKNPFTSQKSSTNLFNKSFVSRFYDSVFANQKRGEVYPIHIRVGLIHFFLRKFFNKTNKLIHQGLSQRIFTTRRFIGNKLYCVKLPICQCLRFMKKGCYMQRSFQTSTQILLI